MMVLRTFVRSYARAVIDSPQAFGALSLPFCTEGYRWDGTNLSEDLVGEDKTSFDQCLASCASHAGPLRFEANGSLAAQSVPGVRKL